MGKIFIPLHVNNNHWVLAVIFVKSKKIRYYDSLRKDTKPYAAEIKQWIQDEASVEKVPGFNIDEWSAEVDKSTPQQKNGYDCGVFMLTCADYLADNLTLLFSQDHIPKRRIKIASAIANGVLPY